MSRSLEQNKALMERAREVIPGGMYGHESIQLLPDAFPQFFDRAKGAYMWDVDGNRYIDYLCAYGPNLLGYGFEPVDQAAAAQQAKGDTLTGPSGVMVDLAEAFVGMVDHADWAMFCKNGSDATSIALVIARAHTGRRKVLVAKGAYHGASIWITPRLAGITAEDRAHVVTYEYNNIESLEAAFKAHAGDVAAVFAAPFRHDGFLDQSPPDVEYAKAARRLCDEHGALLVVDDVRAGFRLARDSSWATVGVKPDLSTFGKAFANGYPISAVLGAEVARAAASKIYVTGSFWFSAVPMAAAVETLKHIRESDYLEQSVAKGQALRDGLHRLAQDHGFGLRQTGPVQMPQILFEDDPDFRVGCAWVAETVKRGVYLHPFHNMFVSTAFSDEDLATTFEACNDAFKAVKANFDNLEPLPGVVALLGGR